MAAFLSSLLIFSFISFGTSLTSNYYQKTCPLAESLVRKAVTEATKHAKTAPAGLLRMHFHDCFIRGCDGSVLLSSKGNNTAEKDGPPNVSLHAFYVIDNAKKAVESVCPGVVSCADILALAARDAVVVSGGPSWDVPTGRKDGRISQATETIQLPAPTFNISPLQQSFSQRGLSLEDLAALSVMVYPKSYLNIGETSCKTVMAEASVSSNRLCNNMIDNLENVASSDDAPKFSATSGVLDEEGTISGLKFMGKRYCSKCGAYGYHDARNCPNK